MNWPPLSADLIEQSIKGDIAALTELLTLTRRPLCEYVQRRIPAELQSTVDPDDIVQTSYAQVFRSIGGFEQRGDDAFSRWLRTIALRILRKAIRSHHAAKRGGGRAMVQDVALYESATALLAVLAATDHTPSRSLAGHERVAAVQRVMEFLNPDQRQAVQLVYLEGRPVGEVAIRMNKTDRAVYNLCDRAKAKLEELLGSRSKYFSKSD